VPVGFTSVPKSGMILPNMGTISGHVSSGLAGALFSPVQQKVLGLLFGQPGRRFQSAELIRLAGSGTGAVHRQLRRLEAAGWVTVTRIGNQKHYQANEACPAFEELRGLIAKTVGLVEPIRAALEPMSEDISVAFIYGSIATALGRTVNPNIMTPEEWKKRRQVPDSFAARIASQPHLFVLGGESDLD